MTGKKIKETREAEEPTDSKPETPGPKKQETSRPKKIKSENYGRTITGRGHYSNRNSNSWLHLSYNISMAIQI
jgi:hypothetical protein